MRGNLITFPDLSTSCPLLMLPDAQMQLLIHPVEVPFGHYLASFPSSACRSMQRFRVKLYNNVFISNAFSGFLNAECSRRNGQSVFGDEKKKQKNDSLYPKNIILKCHRKQKSIKPHTGQLQTDQVNKLIAALKEQQSVFSPSHEGSQQMSTKHHSIQFAHCHHV